MSSRFNPQINLPFFLTSIHWAPYYALGLIGLVGILPFIQRYHSKPLVSFYSEWLAIFLGLAAAIVFITRGFWANLTIPRSAGYLFLLACIVVLQGFVLPHAYPAQWLTPTLYLGWAMLLMPLAVWLRESLGKEKVVEALAGFILAGGLLSAVSGLVQYLGFGGWLGGYVAFKQSIALHGNVAQANHFAAHLLLATSGLCYLFSRGRLSWGLTLGLLLFFAWIASLTSSRAVFLYGLGLSCLSIALYFKTRDSATKRLCLASLGFFVFYVCIQYVLTWLHPWLMALTQGLSQNTSPLDYSTALDKLPLAASGWELRTSEWHKAWLMFREAPLLGVGLGNYAWHSFNYQTLAQFSDIAKPRLFSHAHNLFMQILAETGSAGFLILLGLLVSWVKQFIRHWTQADWFIAASLLVMFIHSNLEFPLWYSYFLGMAAFLFGLGDARVFKISLTPRLAQITSGVILAAGFSLLIFTLLGFQSLKNITLSYSLLTPQEKKDTAIAVAKNPLLTPYAEMLLMSRLQLNKEDIENKLAISTRNFRRNPDPAKVYDQVSFLTLNKQTAEADQLLQKAVKAYPAMLSTYVEHLQRLQPAVQREAEMVWLIKNAKQRLRSLQQASS